MTRWLAVSAVVVLPVVSHAECAWLLWFRHQTIEIVSGPPVSAKEDTWWERQSAFKTYEQCIGAKGRVWAVLASDNLSTNSLVEKVDKVPGELVFVTYKNGRHLNRWVSCYPDTVDPRK